MDDKVPEKEDAVHIANHVDWTQDEERAAVRRLKWIVMPMMLAGFYALQLDRGNISNALTGTLFKDVGITQDQLNNGQTILLLMIVVFEIPSNILLTRLGAKWWISSQILAFSIIASAQCMIRSPAAFYTTRTLLGIAESGFIPGGVYYISTLFTRAELAKMIAWFYIGNICGKGSSGLLAAAILPMQGKGGLPGWSWLFLIEGLIGVVVGMICLLFLPVSALHNRSLIGVKLWSDRQAHILHTRVVLDDPMKENPAAHFKLKPLIFALTRWRMWLHVIYCICGIASNMAVNTYNPQIIRSFGFAQAEANAMSSVGPWLQIPLTLGAGYALSRSPRKGAIMIGITAVMLVLNGVYFGFVRNSTGGIWARYVVMQLIVGFGQPFYTGGLAWATLSARTPSQRSMYSALYIMASNGGQSIGGQMFRGADAPLYITGFTATMSLYGVCFVLAIGITAIYMWSNKYDRADAGEEVGTEEEVTERFRYPI